MKASLQYHHSDPHTDELINPDATLEEAIRIFQDYPWEKEIQAAQKLINQNKTFTTPSVKYESAEGNELIISTSADDYFFIEYFKSPNLYGDFELSNNDLNNPGHFQPEEFIAWFENGTLEEVIQIQEVELSDENEKVTWKMGEMQIEVYMGFILLLPFLAGSTLLLITLVQKLNDLSAVAILGFSFILILLVFYPLCWLPLSYWWNDRRQTVAFDKNKQEITLTRGTLSISFLKSEVQSAVIISPLSSRMDFRYVRLRTNKGVFVITHYTMYPEQLMRIMGIHYEFHEVFTPSIRYHRISKKEKARRAHKSKQLKNEFYEKYQAWDDEQLEDILKNSTDYASYAIDAAKAVLKERGQKPK